MKRLTMAGLAMLAALTTAAAQERTKITVATGVDPSLGTFYVAQAGGFFKKHGLDVQFNTGSSGSAMVAFLVKNQVQAVLAAEQAGIQNFNIDKDVVVATEAMQMLRYFGIVGRNIDSIEGLKGKKIGVAMGSASEVFWRAFINTLKLDPKDYTVMNVELPEMIAAIERGNIDAFSAWEPWITRTLAAVPGTKMLRDNEGIITTRNFVYINKTWADSSPKAAVALMQAISEATDMIRNKPDEASQLVATFLKLDPKLTRDLMGKVNFELRLDQGSIDHLKTMETQLAAGGKLSKPVEWDKFIYPSLIKEVKPSVVNYKLPQ
jgi:ABC-type nitrate/sulfonate/bicarbonate transport system substrate-binding protein